MQSLNGKTALVTGASQSIGLASALALAADDATVVIMGRGKARLASALAALRAQVPRARIEMFAGDACKEEEVKAAFAYTKGLSGKLDILVPTVGGGIMQPILMRDAESVRQELEYNYVSAFLMIRYGAPLLERGGSIVCISTIAATESIFGLGMYGASKAALERLVRAAAFELGGAGIRVNAVRPGMTVPEEVLAVPEQAAGYAAFLKETPLGRIGAPADIARVVRFLAGPEAGWVTGQSFAADGGLEQGRSPDHLDAMYGKDIMDVIRAGQPAERAPGTPSFASTSFLPPKE